jgi:hypothetical protein
MNHALLVSDQHPFAVTPPFPQSGHATACLDPITIAAPALPCGEFQDQIHSRVKQILNTGFPRGTEGYLGNWTPSRHYIQNEDGPGKSTRSVLATLRLLAKQKYEARKSTQFEREMAWLAENSGRYSGQWVALEGSTLLAVGGSARELLSQFGTRPTPPLIIRVKNDERPFAGW